jgi:putative ABC transport system permease protein
MRNLRYALRTLARNPSFSVAAVLVLALGIGANSAIFTVVQAVLLAPLPYKSPERLVRLYERNVVAENPYNVVSWPNFSDWRTQSKSFSDMAVYGDLGASFSPSDGGLPENLTGAMCTYNLFSTLGAPPAMGRAFVSDDDRPDAEQVVIISDSLWRRRFGASRGVIGTRTRIDGDSYNIVGVMPQGFDYPASDAQIWMPVWRRLSPNARQQRGNHRFNVVARLNPGASVGQARTELDGIQARIRQQYPGVPTGAGANVALLQERLVSKVRPMLLILMGAVACVLLIACVNVTNLLLARAAARKRELAIRASLGAGRFELMKQFLTESLLLSTAGAALGLLLANWGTSALIKMAGAIPRIEIVRVNASVLWFTAGVALLTGVVVGLVPAFSSARAALTRAMQESSRSATAGRSRWVFRNVLVATEGALSLMLLLGAGLMLKSFVRLNAVDPGFVPDRLLTIRFSLPQVRYKDPTQRTAFYEAVSARVRAIPGVTAVGIVTVLPLAGHFMDNTFTIEGHPPPAKGQFLDAVVRNADPDYFKTVGIPLKRGRVFTAFDRLDAAKKAVISEAMAAEFFPNEDPIGKRLLGISDKPYEIVGIVGDARQNLALPADSTMYFPLLEGGYTDFAALVIRAAGDPNSLSLPVQKEMRSLDPDLPAVTVRTMDEVASLQTSQSRFGLTLITLFGGLALVLASMGVYGVLAYSIGQRTNELGIRIALGATTPVIARMVVWQGMKPAAAGVIAGLVLGLGTTRLIQSLLFEVKPNDVSVLVAVVAVLSAVALMACFIPAWRATRIDPVIALRAE